MKKMIALATAAFSAFAMANASAQATGPSGADTTTKGTDIMSKDGMTAGAMVPNPKTNDASKPGAPAATSADKGMTSKGTSPQAK